MFVWLRGSNLDSQMRHKYWKKLARQRHKNRHSVPVRQSFHCVVCLRGITQGTLAWVKQLNEKNICIIYVYICLFLIPLNLSAMPESCFIPKRISRLKV